MRLAPILAAAALAAAPASADAAVTVGSSLPPSTGEVIECLEACALVATAVPGATVEVPYDGVVMRWRIRDPLGPGTTIARLVAFRRQPDGSLLKVSESGHLSTQEDGGIATREFGERVSPPGLRVRKGDLLGVEPFVGAAFRSRRAPVPQRAC
jgi:hypothetical protein